MAARRSIHKSSGHLDSMASHVFNLKDMHSQHNTLNGEFLLYQVILKRLLAEGFKKSSEKIKLYDYFHTDDETDQRDLMEFDNNYTAKKAIYWYTRETCIYRLLNKSLRTQNIGDLIVFTQFLRDINNQLSEEQLIFCITNQSPILQVYRGQLINKDEVNRIKHAKGQLLSTSSFLSTSTNRQKAVDFATSKPPPCDTLTTVLLEITLNLEEYNRPFAGIQHLSAFAAEEEVLFMFGCIFRIDDIWEDKQLKLWRIQLTLCGNRDSDITQFQDTMENELQGKDMLVCLGEYLVQMQKFDEAAAHYEVLLNDELITDEFDKACCYHGLAKTNDKRGEYDEAIKNLNLALNYFLNNPKAKDHPLHSQCYNDLGLISSHQENYSLSFKSYEQALKLVNNNQSVTYSGLAKLHYQMGNYQIALEYQYKCLEKQFNTKPLLIASTFLELGKIYGALKEYQKALDMFDKAIRNQQQALNFDHPDLSYTYTAMASMFSDFGEDEKAFDCIKKAFILQSNSLPDNHPDFAETFKHYGNLYKKKKDFDQALHYYNLLLENQLKTLSWKHPAVADTYLLIGNVYLAKNNFDQALIYFHKLLNSQIERLPSGSSILTETYRLIANTYLNKEDFDQALLYFEKLLNNELQKKLIEDPTLANTYKIIGEIYLKKKNLSQALVYFNRLIDTQLRTIPIDEKSVADSYTLIGNIYLKHHYSDKSLLYFDKLLINQAEKQKKVDTIIPSSFRMINDVHFEKRQLDQVLSYFKQSLENQQDKLSLGDSELSNFYKIIGNIYLEKHDFDQALIYYYKLLNNEMKEKSSDDPSLIYTYKVIGDINFQKENFDEALIYFDKLLANELKRKSPKDPSLAETYKIIGNIHLKKYNLLQSIIYFNRLITCQLQIKPIEKKILSEAYTMIGNVFLKVHRFDETLLHHDNKSHIKILTNTLLPYSFRIIGITGNHQNEQCYFNQVIKHYKKLLSDTLDNLLSSDAFKIIGNIYLEQKNFDQTLIYFHKLLKNELQITSLNDTSLTEIYKIIGIIHYEKQNFDQALTYLHKLLDNELQDKQLEDPSLVDLYKIIGNIYYDKDEFSEALIYYNRLLDSQLQAKFIDEKSIDKTYMLIKNIYLKNEFFDKISLNSNNNYLDSTSLRKLSQISSSTASFKIIDNMHFEQRHWDQALNYFHQLLNHQLEKYSFGDRVLSETYKVIGNIYLRKNDSNEALIYFNKLLNNEIQRKTLVDSSLANIYGIIGRIYYEKHSYQQALIFLYRFIHCQKQNQSIEHPSIIDAYRIIGKIYSKKCFSTYFGNTSHHLNLLFDKQPSVKKLLMDTYKRIRNTTFENHQRDHALIYFHKLLDEELENISSNDLYLIIAHIYLEKYDYDDGYIYLNKSLENQIERNPLENSLLGDTYAILADVFSTNDRLNHAIKYYRIALSIYEKNYSSTHWKIRKVERNIHNIVILNYLE
ncbi:unnamed protein product [Adineta steineri]|uniref:Uncharacterized protein n=1 Tax=Adineta steineri TaxID=433720 RepID=A0A815KXG4_9BILA|nr:unnamed protein product [Adineta steineri]CAF1402176.1 unnamed protein product [Adineta steineri]